MTTITLSFPVETEGEKVTELKMRRPKVRDMLAADAGGSDAQKELRLFANLCEVTPKTIENLDMADYLKVQEVYSGFLSSAPATSGNRA